VRYYQDVRSEAPSHLPLDPSSGTWPTEGKVFFQNVKLRYQSDLPLRACRSICIPEKRCVCIVDIQIVLLTIDKVGIIGRTGAGKSSIAQALFRTVELDEGRIIVDGHDLRHLGLSTVCGAWYL
jgi:ATP-binding cassette subfamily C (CFTR/MRP) protein 1